MKININGWTGFTAEDFNFDVTIEGHLNCDPEPRHLAERANAILAEKLKETQLSVSEIVELDNIIRDEEVKYLNSSCEKILGPCACGAWHSDVSEFEGKVERRYNSQD